MKNRIEGREEREWKVIWIVDCCSMKLGKESDCSKAYLMTIMNSVTHEIEFFSTGWKVKTKKGLIQTVTKFLKTQIAQIRREEDSIEREEERSFQFWIKSRKIRNSKDYLTFLQTNEKWIGEVETEEEKEWLSKSYKEFCLWVFLNLLNLPRNERKKNLEKSIEESVKLWNLQKSKTFDKACLLFRLKRADLSLQNLLHSQKRIQLDEEGKKLNKRKREIEEMIKNSYHELNLLEQKVFSLEAEIEQYWKFEEGSGKNEKITAEDLEKLLAEAGSTLTHNPKIGKARLRVIFLLFYYREDLSIPILQKMKIKTLQDELSNAGENWVSRIKNEHRELFDHDLAWLAKNVHFLLESPGIRYPMHQKSILRHINKEIQRILSDRTNRKGKHFSICSFRSVGRSTKGKS